MRLKNFFARGDDEAIMNEALTVSVGGCGPERNKEGKKIERKPSKVVEIREPSMSVMFSQVDTFITAMQKVSVENVKWAQEIMTDHSKFLFTDLKKFGPALEVLEGILAHVVDEDVKYVRNEMSPTQVTEVAAAYIKVIGVRRIYNLFLELKSQLTFEKKSEEKENVTAFDPSRAQSSM